MTDVTLLYFDGCPNWGTTDRQLRELQAEIGFSLGHVRVETAEQARRLGFVGSPTVLVDRTDPFARGDMPAGLACRLYATPDGLQGSPTLEQLREVVA